MRNEENPENPENPQEYNPQEYGGWQPTPQGGEYDAEATAFLQLPPEGALDAAPLEAPGHGYVPPMITPLTPTAASDPSATGTWVVPQQAGEPTMESAASAASAAHWPEPAAADPQATGQWTFPDVGQAPVTGAFPGPFDPSAPSGPSSPSGPSASSESAEMTGQWAVPVADGDLPDESGEFTTSSLREQWGGTTPPATLPGGAPAPWATLPGGAPAPWATGPEEPAPEPQPREEAAEAVPLPEDIPAQAPEEEAPAPTSSTGSAEHPPTSYVLRVNGTDRPVTDAWLGESLLYVLRERLGLAGAKDGCSQGECGACNVQVDGRLVASCLVPAATAAGSEVRTVEGLATDGEPSDVQRALAGCGAVQCGFCIPGMAMTVHDLLEGNHAPTELQTRQALCGNLCRCSGYRGVLDAVREVVAERGASAAAAAEASEEARIPHQAPPGAGSVQPHPHDGGMA
ncbi:2Fe-2S iron-sulfur cluster-binding protein [Streptomyces sp. NBC_01142]|uniref:2Fe-2S iron-sulfur cluster-binding protein n=1 Tax=Streptomyces sp. NBC_01142 TaxID=2975865 RepID=UPI00224E7528|nr:2Fe-2S iron-sulfur cluster-binding protein [Streptomyces sp. NBC_01142]MCX4823447.1 2Fe-2S iron-sulfur cluster-binding protein [Streptomyces sp. NBC_01142]